MEDINTEKIMEEIRSHMETEDAVWNTVHFEDVQAAEREAEGGEEAAFGLQEFDERANAAAANWQVGFFHQIPGGRVKRFVKRVVRKLIRFCVEPITQDITAFHWTVVNALNSLRRFLSRQVVTDKHRDEELARLRRQVAALEERLSALEEGGK